MTRDERQDVEYGLKIKPREDCEGCRFPFDITKLLSELDMKKCLFTKDTDSKKKYLCWHCLRLRMEELEDELDSETKWAKEYFDKWEQAEARIKDLEDKLAQVSIERQIFERASLDGDTKIEELEARLQKLVEAVERHRESIYGVTGTGGHISKEEEEFDEALYKVLKEVNLTLLQPNHKKEKIPTREK